ncbi:MAG UNVERIFIED_CONTAM: hypothetical protein LVR18_12835 [Planctomycetaceae bacterium]|jgi:hypothetical protein
MVFPTKLTVLLTGLVLLSSLSAVAGEDFPVVPSVERQPFVSAVRRLNEALQFAGSPLSEAVQKQLQEAMANTDDRQAVQQLQRILDPLCLALVSINPESRVRVTEGPVAKQLLQQGWRTFLVKVHNEAGINPPLQLESPNALPVYQQGRGAREEPRRKEKLVNPEDVPDRFLDLQVLRREP